MAAVLLGSGCVNVVDVDGYTFDVDPCPPVPPEGCTGTEEANYVISTVSAVLPDRRIADGFDLDGTDANVCGQRDFVSSNETTGIDNQLAALLAFLPEPDLAELEANFQQSILSGETLQVLQIRGIDNLTNDDCVSVTLHSARLPAGVTADENGDGQVDEGLVVDYTPPRAVSHNACIVAGELRVRLGQVDFRLGSNDLDTDRGRLRAAIAPTGMTGWLGGSVTINSIVQSLGADQDALRAEATRIADLDRTEEGVCLSLSWALALETIQVRLGEQVD